jgi:hypothetical protein
MLDSRQHHNLTHDELINILIQSEWEDRENKKITRHTRLVRLRYSASIEEVNFTATRGLDKTQILRLADVALSKRKKTFSLRVQQVLVNANWLQPSAIRLAISAIAHCTSILKKYFPNLK